MTRRVLPAAAPRDSKLGPRPHDSYTPVRPWPPRRPFWITRDSDPEGELSDVCEVWTARPERITVTGSGGTMWLAEGSPLLHLQGRYDVRELAAHVLTLPETDRECVRVG